MNCKVYVKTKGGLNIYQMFLDRKLFYLFVVLLLSSICRILYHLIIWQTGTINKTLISPDFGSKAIDLSIG